MAPNELIPKCVHLTVYGGGSQDLEEPLKQLADPIKEGKIKINIGRVFNLDEIVEAHRVMENNEAGGKIVVLT
jgi:NADPH:quinone reductase-like Zn-dependent oxidoreductase